MASIRPLVTITILAVVGAYLYVKINEGPAPSRAAANALSQSPEGIPPLTGTKGTLVAADGAPPAWPPTAAATTPPPMTPAPAAVSANSPTVGAANPKDNFPAVPAIPELPPLPSLNDSAITATQSAPPLPKDLSANITIAKDAPGQPSPLTATDPGKPNSLATAPQASVTAPMTTPSTTPTLNPAANAASPAPPAGAGVTTATPPSQSSAQNSLRSAPPATASDDRYGSTSPATVPPAQSTAPTTPIGAPTAASFAASWPAIQSALDRRDLKQAHQLLSKWHGNESLSPTDTQKVETLLSQLAGTVIYSTEHQLEPARVVKPGETLDSIAKEYNVPPQLLGKINGIQTPDQLRPGQELKVVRGPFAAVIDLSRNEITLTVDERYAGKFRVTAPPGTAVTDGQWLVDQKVAGAMTPASPSAYTTTPIPADRSIVLRNAAATAGGASTLIISSGPPPTGLSASAPSLRISAQDAEEISDILSVGSRVVVRK